MSIIEELWYGNISPCDAEIRNGSAYAELVGYDFLKQIFKNPHPKFSCYISFSPEHNNVARSKDVAKRNV